MPLLVRDKQEHEPKTKKCKSNQEQEDTIDYTYEDEPSIEDMDEYLDRLSDGFSFEDF